MLLHSCVWGYWNRDAGIWIHLHEVIELQGAAEVFGIVRVVV